MSTAVAKMESEHYVFADYFQVPVSIVYPKQGPIEVIVPFDPTDITEAFKKTGSMT